MNKSTVVMMASTSSSGTRKKLGDDPYSGPYKATRLWNDVILAFRENLPCGRHRRLMRTFDNCFSGSSAADWLLQYLKSNRNFGSDVKREKAVSLLNKLYTAGIFEEVKVSKTMQHKSVVQDSRLYRLLPASPSKLKITRLPLAPRNDACLGRVSHSQSSIFKKDNGSKKDKGELPHPQVKKATLKSIPKTSNRKELDEENKQQYPACRIVPRVLSSSEVTEVWKRTFIFRLKKALVDEYLSEDLINGSFIMHNCVYLNKNGTVTNIAPDDQLPQWVLSAMKCLARWPEHHEEGLPNYPGFEKDVFGVVKNYFAGLEEPLIPFQLYDAITNVFVSASSRSSNQSDEMFTSKERESIIKNLWTTASLENIILDLSKKYSIHGATEDKYENESIHNDFTRETFEKQDNGQFSSHDKELCDSNINIANEESFCKYRQYRPRYGRQKLSRSVHSSSVLAQRKHNALPMRKFGSAPNLKVSKYETAFGPDNHTVTRVFYQNGVCTDYRHCDLEEENNSYSPIETHFSASTEDLVHRNYPVNFERVGSLEYIHLNEYESKDDIGTSTLPKLHKSKSFASRSENYGDGNGYFSLRKRRDDSDAFQLKGGGFCRLSQSVEAEPEYLWASQESLCTHDRLQPVPEYANTHVQSPNTCYSPQYMDRGSVCNIQRNDSVYQTSARSMRHHMSHVSLRDDQDFIKYTESPPPFHSMTSLHNYSHLSHNDSNNYGPGYRPVLDASKERSCSTTNLSPHGYNPLPTRSLSILSRNSHHMTSTPLSLLQSTQTNSFGQYQSGASLSSLTPFHGRVGTRRHNSHSSSFISYPQTRLSEERVKCCLQLFMLVIAPGNRRKLHMLFKMMVKMIANPNLCLDYTQTTRSLVLETFYQSIIRTQKECDMDEMLVLQLLSFMLDYYDDIFTPPSDLKTQVFERVKQMQRPQVSYSPGHHAPLQYCQKISVTDFENEKNTVSRQAMEELLESIVKNTKMSVKEKHKHLKQFQMTYPTIYKKRFPTQESEAEIVPAPSKPKLKPPLVIRPMNRLRGLRL